MAKKPSFRDLVSTVRALFRDAAEKAPAGAEQHLSDLKKIAGIHLDAALRAHGKARDRIMGQLFDSAKKAYVDAHDIPPALKPCEKLIVSMLTAEFDFHATSIRASRAALKSAQEKDLPRLRRPAGGWN
jgi:hypothetical protein